MLNKVKKWLGIEGVKLDLILPEEVDRRKGVLNGKIRLSSMQAQRVTGIRIVMVERYARGRKTDKRIDDYEMGTLQINETYEVPAEGQVELKFSLSFSLVESEMDSLQRSNFLTGGLIRVLKYAEGVQSTYRVEAEALVEGVALNPFDKKEVALN
ncbi:MAG: sporulation protein [Bacteroidota bacterium]